MLRAGFGVETGAWLGQNPALGLAVWWVWWRGWSWWAVVAAAYAAGVVLGSAEPAPGVPAAGAGLMLAAADMSGVAMAVAWLRPLRGRSRHRLGGNDAPGPLGLAQGARWAVGLTLIPATASAIGLLGLGLWAGHAADALPGIQDAPGPGGLPDRDRATMRWWNAVMPYAASSALGVVSVATPMIVFGHLEDARDRLARHWRSVLGVAAVAVGLLAATAVPLLQEAAEQGLGEAAAATAVPAPVSMAAAGGAGEAAGPGASGGADAPWVSKERLVSLKIAFGLPALLALPLWIGVPGAAASVAMLGGAFLLLLRILDQGGQVDVLRLSGWAAASSVLGGVLLIFGAGVDERRRQHRHLRQRSADVLSRRDRLRRLTFRLLSDQQALRSRLATRLHDRPIQSLAIAGLNLAAAQEAEAAATRSYRGAAEARALLQDAEAALTLATSSMRGVLRGLSPPVLVTLGLFPALRSLVNRWQDDGLVVRLSLPPQDPPRPTPVVEAFGLKVASELLRNVHRHAGVGEAELGADVDTSTRELRLWVRDAGVGGPTLEEVVADPEDDARLSLFAIREVVESLGGVMRMESIGGQGLEVRLRVPSPRDSYDRPGGRRAPQLREPQPRQARPRPDTEAAGAV